MTRIYILAYTCISIHTNKTRKVMKTTQEQYLQKRDKEYAFDLLVIWMEKHKDSIPSYLEYDFKHVHDGISVTPKHSNYIGISEMEVFNGFCMEYAYGLGVFVLPNATAPSVIINIWKY